LAKLPIDIVFNENPFATDEKIRPTEPAAYPI
jgi:hypothetical protein